MTDKLMYIPNDGTQNHPFCRLRLVVETFEVVVKESTNQNSIKCLKLLSLRVRKLYIKLFGLV